MSALRSRNLSDARTAYSQNDAAASLRAHSAPPTTSPSEGGHSTSYNDTAMAVTMGMYKQASKGTLFSLILISALAPRLPWAAVFWTLASLSVAGGVVVYLLASMDHSIEAQVYDRERRREAWELKNYRKGEVDEIIELFESRGLSHEDASIVVNKMATYDEFFVDLMMAEELMMVKPLPVETTPYRFALEGLSFALSMLLPLCVAKMLQVTIGGAALLPWAWMCCAVGFAVALCKIHATNQLKSSQTVVYYGGVTLAVVGVVLFGIGQYVGM